MFRNPSHSSISIYLPDTLTCSTHSRARLPRGKGGRYWGGSNLYWLTQLRFLPALLWSFVFSPYFAEGRKRLFKRNVFSGPWRRQLWLSQTMEQPGCGCCCCKFNEHNGKVFDETIREIRESKASFNKVAAAVAARRWSYRLLSYSARQLQLLKTRARQSASTQGKRCRRAVEAPEPGRQAHKSSAVKWPREEFVLGCWPGWRVAVARSEVRSCVATLQPRWVWLGLTLSLPYNA